MLSGAEHHADGVGVQPARDESQHRQRFRVQPLGIVDQADQRTFRGDVGQQRQCGQAHQKSARRRPPCETERHLQRIAVRAGQPVADD